MMATTHALAGLALGAVVAVLVPETAAAARLAGLAGGVFPDLDLYSGHRRTLHYPTGYVAGAIPVGVAGFVWPTPVLVVAAFLLAGAALHCRMDRYGGGLELRPWEGTSERAVYDHVRGRWRRPKRWIPYDGAPADLALAAVVGLPLLFVFEEYGRALVTLALVVGTAYALLRRRLANLAPLVAGVAPEPVTSYVPDRYRD